MAENTVGALYTDGGYLERHPDWHLAESPGKARDILKFVDQIASEKASAEVSIADIGAGVCGVLAQLVSDLEVERPKTHFSAFAFEPSADAARRAASLYPTIDVANRGLSKDDGPFDVALFVDVLEHLENPRELLRTSHQAATHVVVRQPLLENFSTFRHRNYKQQRETWGHIAYFNYYSFLDLMEDCGWKPRLVELAPPWALAGQRRQPSFLKRTIARRAPILASYFLAPFYLLGSFEKI